MSTIIETRLPDNRNANLSLEKILKPIYRFFVCIFNSLVEARRLQAAYETARHLTTHNKDFKQMSHSEIVQWILNKDNK